MRFLSTLLVAASVAAFSFAAEKYELTGDNTKVEFTGTKKGGKHDGGFKKLTGTATVTGTDTTTLKLEVELTTSSLFSDDAKLTDHLKGADFFDVKTNETAKFVSTKVETHDKQLKITGDLTLNGKTKSITFPTTTTLTATSLKLTSTFKIDRSEFGMTYGKGMIDNDVEIRVTVDAKK